MADFQPFAGLRGGSARLCLDSPHLPCGKFSKSTFQFCGICRAHPAIVRYNRQCVTMNRKALSVSAAHFGLPLFLKFLSLAAEILLTQSGLELASRLDCVTWRCHWAVIDGSAGRRSAARVWPRLTAPMPPSIARTAGFAVSDDGGQDERRHRVCQGEP